MIVIKRFENQDRYTYADVVNLLHLAFAEHLKQGLNYLAAVITEEEYRCRTQGGIIFIAEDTSKKILVGTEYIKIYKDNDDIKYASLYNVGIHPAYKGCGIGSLLFKERETIALSMGCHYMISDTSNKAKDAVSYHLKNGFKIIGLLSHPNTSYYSYLFRKQLVHPSKYDYHLLCKWLYYKSSFRTRLQYKANGNLTLLYKLFAIIKRITTHEN